MKIDMFPHILPEKYYNKLIEKAPPKFYMAKRWKAVPCLTDLTVRFRIMDKFDDYVQMLTLSSPPIEEVFGPQDSPELARMGNDEMAELVAKYPSRFPGAVACLPMNNIDASVKELDRAVNELGMKGVMVYTSVNGKPLDSSEFSFLFEKMAEYDLPIWLHPVRGGNVPDYNNEKRSMYDIWIIFGWPFDTSAAMTRIVFSGVFDKYPNLKIITHHLGGMAPFFGERIKAGYEEFGTRSEEDDKSTLSKLKRHPFEYFPMFYADTSLHGSTSALECGFSFFGPDKILFGTDMPFDPTQGERKIRRTIESVLGMTASNGNKGKIFELNARRIAKLE